MNHLNNTVIFEDLGSIDYKTAWDYQEVLFQKLILSKSDKCKLNTDLIIKEDNYLLFCEHPHVYTLGKSGDEKNLLLDYIQLQAKEATFFKTNRGGDITYHGPGQIVGYPIIDLEKFNLGVKQYIHLLEKAIILTLKDFNIQSERLEGATGVWIDTNNKALTRKICAIGVRCSRYITMHGFAFNVNTDLNYFKHINPCGFTDKAVTSLAFETNKNQNIDQIKEILLNHLVAIFGIKLIKKQLPNKL